MKVKFFIFQAVFLNLVIHRGDESLQKCNFQLHFTCKAKTADGTSIINITRYKKRITFLVVK